MRYRRAMAPRSSPSQPPLRKRDRPRADHGDVVFRTHDGVLFGATPKPTDARQGIIGDCYYLSALSALARSQPERLRAMLRAAGDGTYVARFHRHVDGGWLPEEIAIDGAVPVRARDGHPIYARSQSLEDGRAELWPLLAEKAYAAWKGGYDVMGEGGLVERTLEELTGEPTRMLFTAEVAPEELWDLLSRATADRWPTVVCTYGRRGRPGIDELGFHPNHIVIFLGVHTWMGRRIVWLRDPFDVPACGTLVHPDPHGVYTIAWDDFLAYFAEVEINAEAAHAVSLSPWPRVTIGDALDRSYVFGALAPAARRQLAREHVRIVAPAGEVIAAAKTPADHVYVIEHGSAAIEIPTRRGRANRVAVAHAGDTFGEIHALEERSYDATLRALTPMALYRLPRAKLRAWVTKQPELEARLRRRFELRITMLEWGERQITTVNVDSLLRAGQERELARGETLWTEGEPATWIGLVVEGRIEVAFGRRKRLAVVKPGGVVGEGEVLERKARITTATAASKSRILQIDLGAAGEQLEHFDLVQRQLAAIAGRREKSLKRLVRHR